MEIKFRGIRERKGCIVLVSHDGGESYAKLPLYLDWLDRSPTGFEWGYYGSGPSQLAYALLHHYFVVMEGLDEESAHEEALDAYVEFKQKIVGSIREDNWELDEIDFSNFLWERYNAQTNR